MNGYSEASFTEKKKTCLDTDKPSDSDTDVCEREDSKSSFVAEDESCLVGWRPQENLQYENVKTVNHENSDCNLVNCFSDSSKSGESYPAEYLNKNDPSHNTDKSVHQDGCSQELTSCSDVGAEDDHASGISDHNYCTTTKNTIVDSDIAVGAEISVTSQSIGNSHKKNEIHDSQTRPLLPMPNVFVYPAKFRPGIPIMDQVLMIADSRPMYMTSKKMPCLAPKPLIVNPTVQTNSVKVCEPAVNSRKKHHTKRSMNTQTLGNLVAKSKVIKGEIQPKLSTSTQTGVKSYCQIAQTQTPGDFILLKAMESAQIPIEKESRASQVSPRTRQQTATCHTQTVLLSPKQRQRRRKRNKVVERNDFCVNTDMMSLKEKQLNDFATNTELSVNVSDDVQTRQGMHVKKKRLCTEMVELFPSSMSTQTLESFLSKEFEPVLNQETASVCDSASLVSDLPGIEDPVGNASSQLPLKVLHPKDFSLPRSLDSLQPMVKMDANSNKSSTEEQMQQIPNSRTSYYRTMFAKKSKIVTSASASGSSANVISISHSVDRVSSEIVRITQDAEMSTVSNTCENISMAVSPIVFDDDVPRFSAVSSSKDSACSANLDSLTASSPTLAHMCTNTDVDFFSADIRDCHVQTDFDPLLPLSLDINNDIDAVMDCQEKQVCITVDMETTTEFDFPVFLNSNTQTVDSQAPFISSQNQKIESQTQTQTHVDDLLDFDNLWTHMETQTSADDFLAGLGLVDIETQTATNQELMPFIDVGNVNSAVEPQNHCNPALAAGGTSAETQTNSNTLLRSLELGVDLSDSQTQTTWKNLESFVSHLT